MLLIHCPAGSAAEAKEQEEALFYYKTWSHKGKQVADALLTDPVIPANLHPELHQRLERAEKAVAKAQADASKRRRQRDGFQGGGRKGPRLSFAGPPAQGFFPNYSPQFACVIAVQPQWKETGSNESLFREM